MHYAGALTLPPNARASRTHTPDLIQATPLFPPEQTKRLKQELSIFETTRSIPRR